MTLVLVAALSLGLALAPPQVDPRVAAARAENASEITRLSGVAANPSRPPGERVASLRRLALLSDEDALKAAAALRNDAEAAVAEEAVDLLSSAVALMGNHSADHGGTPWGDAVAKQHTLASSALRDAAADPRAAIADRALASLARLSDPTGISMIRQRLERNQIAPKHAAQLCAQAAPQVGRSCLIDLLNDGSPEGQIAAIDFLGSRAADQQLVRNKILFNARTSISLRTAAANTLGRFDPTFDSYGMLLAADPATPPSVFAAVLEAYATRSSSAGNLGSLERSQLLRAVANKIEEVKRHTPSDREQKALRPLLRLQKQLQSDHFR